MFPTSGTDFEITLSKPEDLERAMPLLKRSYEDS
jgi:predicted transport protein